MAPTPIALERDSTSALPDDPRGGSRRDDFLDNARLALIVLVVLAHVMRLFLFDTPSMRALYVWLIVFLMPAFAAIAGHLSRPSLRRRDVGRLVGRVVLPYLVFELVYTLLTAATRGGDPDLAPWTPTWLLWFLPALFLWRVTLPILMRTRAPLVASVAVGIAAGFLPAPVYTLGIMRFLALYPFFVLGHLARRERFAAPPRAGGRIAAATVLGALGAATALGGPGLEVWLHGTQPYAAMDVPAVAGPPLRLLHYAGSAAAALAFLALVPRSRSRLGAGGERTLYVYLLHGIVLLPASVIVPRAWTGSPAAAPVLLGAGVVLALALSTRPVERATRFLVDPLGASSGTSRVSRSADPFEPSRSWRGRSPRPAVLRRRA